LYDSAVDRDAGASEVAAASKRTGRRYLLLIAPGVHFE
jgi:hypothetical protein